jgi:signal transduction histidine kinase
LICDFGIFLSKGIMNFESIEDVKKNRTEAKRLISMLAHDLRSPIFNVIGFADLLEQLWQNETNPHIKLYIDLIRKEAENSLQLIDSFANKCNELQVEIGQAEKNILEDILSKSKRARQESLVNIN